MDEQIEKNMGLVISIVNSFHPKTQTERQDLIDAGRIGLWKALQKFDETSENSLSTYAWRPIRWSIIREIRNNKRHTSISIETLPEPYELSKECLWETYTSDITEKEKTVVEMRAQGLKFREICEELNEPPSVVKNRFYRTISKLKKANAE